MSTYPLTDMSTLYATSISGSRILLRGRADYYRTYTVKDLQILNSNNTVLIAHFPTRTDDFIYPSRFSTIASIDRHAIFNGQNITITNTKNIGNVGIYTYNNKTYTVYLHTTMLTNIGTFEYKFMNGNWDSSYSKRYNTYNMTFSSNYDDNYRYSYIFGYIGCAATMTTVKYIASIYNTTGSSITTNISYG